MQMSLLEEIIANTKKSRADRPNIIGDIVNINFNRIVARLKQFSQDSIDAKFVCGLASTRDADAVELRLNNEEVETINKRVIGRLECTGFLVSRNCDNITISWKID